MVRVRKFKKKDTITVTKLIHRVAKNFLRAESTKSALENYLALFDTKRITKKKLLHFYSNSNIFFVAEDKNKIIGMIRGRHKKGRIRLVNLFVDGEYHYKGIGRKLVEKFEAEAKKHGKVIKIRASLYATPFYKKLGYKRTTGTRKFHGMPINPMQKHI